MEVSAFVIFHANNFRGGGVFSLVGTQLIWRIRNYCKHPKYPNVVVPSMVRFKGQTGEKNVLLLLVKKPTMVWSYENG